MHGKYSGICINSLILLTWGRQHSFASTSNIVLQKRCNIPLQIKEVLSSEVFCVLFLHFQQLWEAFSSFWEPLEETLGEENKCYHFTGLSEEETLPFEVSSKGCLTDRELMFALETLSSLEKILVRKIPYFCLEGFSKQLHICYCYRLAINHSPVYSTLTSPFKYGKRRICGINGLPLFLHIVYTIILK